MPRNSRFYRSNRNNADVEVIPAEELPKDMLNETAETAEEAVAAAPQEPAPPVQRAGGFRIIPQAKFIDSETDQMDLAVNLMLDYLPADCKDLVLEYHATTGAPLWQIIAGYVLRAREMGLMFTPVMLAEWEDKAIPNAIRPCEYCDLPVRPKTWGQKRCCNACVAGKVKELGHSEDCAIDWSVVEEQP